MYNVKQKIKIIYSQKSKHHKIKAKSSLKTEMFVREKDWKRKKEMLYLSRNDYKWII